MMKTIFLLFFILLCLNTWAESNNPYGQQINRNIKALSDKDIENYLNGKGMGFAKAAELNHYPGPKHVLELAIPLELTQSQIDQTKILFKQMKVQAMRLGKQVVEEEKILDHLFANKDVNQINLGEQLDKITSIKSQLRFIHLNTHLQQKLILTKEQISKYDELRGYTSGHSHKHTH